jgi:hypothetical protein
MENILNEVTTGMSNLKMTNESLSFDVLSVRDENANN